MAPTTHPDRLRSLIAKPWARLAALAVATVVGLGGVALTWGAGGSSFVTSPVQRGRIVSAVSAVGSINPVDKVEVGSQVSGQIAELLVDFNDRVVKGQPLARLDSQIHEATVREAEAELEIALANVLIQEASLKRSEAELANTRAGKVAIEARTDSNRAKLLEAKRELERKKTLRAKGTVAQSQVDKALAEHDSARALLRAEEAQRSAGSAEVRGAEAALLMAEATLQNALADQDRKQAALDRARIELARTTVRAPIDGVVVDRKVELGQTVAASLQAPTLFTLAKDLSQVMVETFVDEADIGRIRVGQDCTFGVDAHPGRVFHGTVRQIRKAPQVFENVVTYTVMVAAENPEQILMPGMTASVELIVQDARQVLAVPNAALRFAPRATEDRRIEGGDSRAIVWLLDGAARLKAVEVEVGMSDGRLTELVSGALQEGQEVVIAERPGH